MMRIGQGYDAHQWADDDRPLVIGGVYFPETPGLDGRSGPDVVSPTDNYTVRGGAGFGDFGPKIPGDSRESFSVVKL